MLGGEWSHTVLVYDGSKIGLYLNGSLVDETEYTGYLDWGDGADHTLYLNRYGTAGWESMAIFDELRIYKRALSVSEISQLWSSGTGDLGLSPLVVGPSPFATSLVSQSVSFLDGNATVSVTGLTRANSMQAKPPSLISIRLALCMI